MQSIDEQRLESDLGYRFEYLAGFLELTPQDVDAIHAVAALISPLVPALVDAVYQKLYQYSSTWRHFLPRQDGYAGAMPQSLEEMSPDHEVIRFRKQHLGRYLASLVTKPYDGKMIEYLDRVGKIHTPLAGSTKINVPLVQMHALLGYVSDVLLDTILGFDLPDAQRRSTVRAFNKLLWLQNDLIGRHYAAKAELATA